MMPALIALCSRSFPYLSSQRIICANAKTNNSKSFLYLVDHKAQPHRDDSVNKSENESLELVEGRLSYRCIVRYSFGPFSFFILFGISFKKNGIVLFVRGENVLCAQSACAQENSMTYKHNGNNISLPTTRLRVPSLYLVTI